MSDANLTLPTYAPTSLLRFEDDEHIEDLPLAMYALVDVTKEELQNLASAAKNASEEVAPNLKIPSGWDFAGQTAQAIYEAHLRLSEDDQPSEKLNFHPYVFVIANSKNFETDGVVMVTLMRNRKCKIHPLRLDIKYIGEVMANISIANMDWFEFEYADFRPSAFRDSESLIDNINEDEDNEGYEDEDEEEDDNDEDEDDNDENDDEDGGGNNDDNNGNDSDDSDGRNNKPGFVILGSGTAKRTK